MRTATKIILGTVIVLVAFVSTVFMVSMIEAQPSQVSVVTDPDGSKHYTVKIHDDINASNDIE
jgi:hypothetical protein